MCYFILMLTVTIAYKSNPLNLAVLLAQLQPQLHPDDDIYIIDSSPKKDALKLAALYGTTRCYIFVEPTKYENSLQYGIQSMVDNNQEAMLFLREDCFISSTFIANIKKTIDSPFQIISPRVYHNPYAKMDSNFKLYNSSDLDLQESDDFNASCFLLTRQSKRSYGLLNNEYVAVNQKFHI